MKNKIKNGLLYGGLKKEEYLKIIPKIITENFRILQMYEMIIMVAFSILAVAAYFTNTFANKNMWTYVVCAVLGLVMFLICRKLVDNKSVTTMRLMIFVLMSIVYGFSLYITYIHSDKPAVTTIIFLVILPLLFTDKPINIIGITFLGDMAFCILSYMVKSPDLSQIDIWNGVSFGFLGMFAGVFVINVKLRNIYQTEQITYLSETDILTGTKNRNHYERYLNQLNQEDQKDICCVFVDVNALHECNNTQGHKAGDRMLQFVARTMIEIFGQEHTFRIGGDEFVSFARGWKKEKMDEALQDISARCSKHDYSVSAGFSSTQIYPYIDEMIQDAEKKMYEEKRKYYSHSNHDRRRSSAE